MKVHMAKGVQQSVKLVLVIAVLAILLMLSSRAPRTEMQQNIAGQAHAPAPNCADSDGGRNYPVWGMVTGEDSAGQPYRYGDVCGSSTQLFERYCSGSSPDIEQYPCPYGCASGQCNPPPPPTPPPPAPNCADSDGGINYYVFGQVSGYDASGRPYLYNDQCMNTISLYERYCSGSYSNGQQYNCPYGCAAGRCNNQTNTTNTTVQCGDGQDNDGDTKRDFGVSETSDSKCTSASDNDESPRDYCADSDGLDFYIRGAVNGQDESIPFGNSDYCQGAILVEYTCAGRADDYRPRSQQYPCPYGCANGACTSQCNDGVDNDGEGADGMSYKIDYGFTEMSDSKCSSMSDNDESPRDYCTDTDGLNYNIRGGVSGENEGARFGYTDYCQSTTTLSEFYCMGRSADYMPNQQMYTCPRGCASGRCL